MHKQVLEAANFTNHWNNTLESRICFRRSKSSFTSRQAWPNVSAIAAYTSALGLWFEINWSACRSNSSTGLCLLFYQKFVIFYSLRSFWNICFVFNKIESIYNTSRYTLETKKRIYTWKSHNFNFLQYTVFK